MRPTASLIWKATLLGLATGVGGTAVGGLAAALLGRPSRRVSSTTLGFAAGVMLAIVGLDLFPEAIRRGGLLFTSLGLILGVGLIYVLDLLLPHSHANFADRESRRRARFTRTALLIGFGVALHNFPEGVAVGSGYALGTGFGLAVVTLIFFQNVPEGLAVAAPYLIAGHTWRRAVGLTALAGLPQMAGSLVGAAASAVSPAVLSLSLAFSGGAMLFIVGDELLPEAHELAEGHTAALGLVAGVLAGMVLTALLAGS